MWGSSEEGVAGGKDDLVSNCWLTHPQPRLGSMGSSCRLEIGWLIRKVYDMEMLRLHVCSQA
jgi:hypothetical protein